MYLKPCRNCPHRDRCSAKAEKLISLRGLGFTSANFKCDKRLSTLPPGQRIKFEMGDCDETYTYQAIVMRARRTKILVWLVSCDDEECVPCLMSGKNPIAVSPDRVTPIDGQVALCPECGQPEGTRPQERKDGASKWFCPCCAGWQRVEQPHWTEWVKPQKAQVEV